MTSRGWSAAAVLLTGVTVSVPVLLHAQTQQRVMYASAVDQNGAPVADLGPSDFIVREDKVAREVLSVAPAREPMQISLLVDNSQFADRYVRDLREGLTAFITAIANDPGGVKHQVAVITIGERPTINTDSTTNLEQAIKGAQRIFAMPGSAAYLLDGVIETSKGIKKREAARPVMIAIITPGVDYSDRPYQSALEPLRESGAAFHVMVVGRPITETVDRMMLLDFATRDTGGRYDTVLTGTGLTPRMKELAQELTHQYKVTYAHPQTLIPPDRVTITAAKPEITVRGIAQKPSTESNPR